MIFGADLKYCVLVVDGYEAGGSSIAHDQASNPLVHIEEKLSSIARRQLNKGGKFAIALNCDDSCNRVYSGSKS
eukprot:4485871-Amphidinium_carterae.1